MEMMSKLQFRLISRWIAIATCAVIQTYGQNANLDSVGRLESLMEIMANQTHVLQASVDSQANRLNQLEVQSMGKESLLEKMLEMTASQETTCKLASALLNNTLKKNERLLVENVDLKLTNSNNVLMMDQYEKEVDLLKKQVEQLNKANNQLDKKVDKLQEEVWTLKFANITREVELQQERMACKDKLAWVQKNRVEANSKQFEAKLKMIEK